MQRRHLHRFLDALGELGLDALAKPTRIVRPVAQLSHVADQVSTGNFEIPEFPERGKDEIALLGRAFNRMRRSLQKAMQMIES